MMHEPIIMCPVCEEKPADKAIYLEDPDNPYVKELVNDGYGLCRDCYESLLHDVEKDERRDLAIIYVSDGIVQAVALPPCDAGSYSVADVDIIESGSSEPELRYEFMLDLLSMAKPGMRLL